MGTSWLGPCGWSYLKLAPIGGVGDERKLISRHDHDRGRSVQRSAPMLN
jgi:hypothetical protein